MTLESIIGSFEDTLAEVQKEVHCVVPSSESRPMPYHMYKKLLCRISERFDKDMRDAFKFYVRKCIPELVLEEESPLSWFRKLEDSKMISIDNLSILEEFLNIKHMYLWLDVIKEFNMKVKIMTVLSHKLQCKSHKNVDLFGGEDLMLSGKPSNKLIKSYGQLDENPSKDVESADTLLKGVHELLIQYGKSHDEKDVAYNSLVLSEKVFEKYGKWMIENRYSVSTTALNEQPSKGLWLTPERKKNVLEFVVAILIRICKFKNSCRKPVSDALTAIIILLLMVIIALSTHQPQAAQSTRYYKL